MQWNRVLDECTSTNDEMRRLADQGAPHGAWIAARKQTAGRGRRSREWVGFDGNLLMSSLIRGTHKDLWTWLPLITAVAVVNECPDVSLQIKWPNDLLIEGKKCGGILCEAQSRGSESFCIVGIGVNLARAPEQVPDAATLRVAQSAEQLAPKIARSLADLWQRALAGQLDSIVRVYEQRAAIKPGDPLTWMRDGQQYTGICEGLDADGALRVKDAQSQVITLYSEEVSVRRAV